MPAAPLYRRDFKLLADLRANEARVLLASGKVQGAYYLTGYAIECALKACIAKKTKRFEFPPKPDQVRKLYSHSLLDLIRLAGLEDQLDSDVVKNPALGDKWLTVRDWTEESRYSASQPKAKQMYNAALGPTGLLQWIKQHW